VADPAYRYAQASEYIKKLKNLAYDKKLAKGRLDHELGLLQRELDEAAKLAAIQFKSINKVDTLVADITNFPRMVRERIKELNKHPKKNVPPAIKQRLLGELLNFSGTNVANGSIKALINSGTLTRREMKVLADGIKKRMAKQKSPRVIANMREELGLLRELYRGKKPKDLPEVEPYVRPSHEDLISGKYGEEVKVLAEQAHKARMDRAYMSGRVAGIHHLDEANLPEQVAAVHRKHAELAAEEGRLLSLIDEKIQIPPPRAPVIEEPVVRGIDPPKDFSPEEVISLNSHRLPDDVVELLNRPYYSWDVTAIEDHYLIQRKLIAELEDGIKTLKSNYDNIAWSHPGPGPWRSTIYDPTKQLDLFGEKFISSAEGIERMQPGRIPEVLNMIKTKTLKEAHGIGPSMHRRLIDAFGSEDAALRATREELLQVKGVGKKNVDKLYNSIREATIEQITEARPTNITMQTIESIFAGRKINRVVDYPGLDEGGLVRSVDDLKKHINTIRKKEGKTQAWRREERRRQRDIAWAKDPEKPFEPVLTSPGKRGYITLQHVKASGESSIPQNTRLNIDDFETLFFREIEMEDVGIRTTRFERNHTVGFDQNGQIGAKASIQTDNRGVRYAVRALREGDANYIEPKPLSDAQAQYLTEYNSVMNDFHDDFVRAGLLQADQLGFNPLTGAYFPRNNVGGLHFLEEALLPQARAGGKARFEKRREEAFGKVFGEERELRKPIGIRSTIENIQEEAAAAWKAHDGTFTYQFLEDTLTGVFKRVDDRWRQSAMDPAKVLPSYIRAASRRIAQRNLELGVMDLFGVTRASQLEIVKKNAQGTVIDDLTSLPEGYYTEAVPNRAWKAMEEAAEADKPTIKMLKNADGEEVAVPAEAYRWVKNFDEDGTKAMKGMHDRLSQSLAGRAILEVTKLGATMSNAFKRTVLVGRPQYHVINIMNDSLQLLTMGMNRPVHYIKEAKKLLKDPENYKLKLSNGKYIDGITLLKSAREQGLVSNTAARLDVFGGDALRMTDRLELESIRHSGKGINWKKWQARGKKWGIKQGETFAAWWTDHAQLAGYMYRMKYGDTASMAARRTFDALMDYSDRDTTLNVLRFFAPFATWAAKAPAMTAKAFVMRPGAVTLPVRWFESLEAGAERREGPSYAKPPWMKEAGGYFRMPSSYKEAYGSLRAAAGGNRLSKDEQFFLRSRIPYLDALAPPTASIRYLMEGKGLKKALSPWAMQLGPTEKLAIEAGFEEDILTDRWLPAPSLTKPFAQGTRFVPQALQARPGQSAWFSRYFVPHLSAMPYIGPLFSPVFTTEMNAANRSGKFLGIKIAEPNPHAPTTVLGGRRETSISMEPEDIIAKQRLAQGLAISGKAISPGQSIASRSIEFETASEEAKDWERALYRIIYQITMRGKLEEKRKVTLSPDLIRRRRE